MQAIRLGDVRIFRIEEMIWDLEHTFLFPDLTRDDFAPHMDWLAPRFMTDDLKIRLSVAAFVIVTPHHTIIVDTCFGNGKEGRPMALANGLQLPFLERMKEQAGVTPEDVDYVFCTHFHVDHVGWNTRLVNGRWEPTFPNARYLFQRAEFEYYTSLPQDQQQPSLLDSVLPIAEAGKADLVDGAHRIGDFVILEPTPGHTPGHTSVSIVTPSGNAVITGDMIHTPAQVIETGWSPQVDHDPALAIQTRRAFIERHAEAGTQVLGTHFAPPTACRFVPNGEGYRPVFED